MISPAVFQSHGIQVKTTIQRESQVVVLLPGTYHFGYNMGYNVAQAMNFATEG